MSTNKTYNENYVREAAYYCWKNAGCPWGQDEYFWNMAINQLYGSNCNYNSSCCNGSTSCSSSKKSSSSSKKTSSKK
ncbi:MAG: DUF2934 domain-containing protein [Alphaproteobacteria bacterium]|nr:DUF2934 domain-containing protein [Alphaproteobacteria bacterium]